MSDEELEAFIRDGNAELDASRRANKASETRWSRR